MLASAPADASHLGDEEAERLFAPLAGVPHLLLAVSGGPDSMALMGLAARWARGAARPRLSVATVDHGLRPGSADDAGMVCEAAEALGLACVTLIWREGRPSSCVQAAARAARYALLATHAEAVGAGAVVTAHTLDDQAETVLLRLAAGSGVAGLGAMRERSMMRGLPLMRPFLGVAKARLIATCGRHGWPYVVDPANRAPRFARGRLRAARAVLEREGLTDARLAALAARAGSAAEALDWAAERLFPQVEDVETIDLSPILDAPPAIARLVLRRWMAGRGGDEPRLERLEACADALIAAARAGRAARRTLGGLVLSLSPAGLLRACPETRRRGLVNPAGRSRLGKGRGQP
jgi:tRNA(Ile)-lysidine synthase